MYIIISVLRKLLYHLNLYKNFTSYKDFKLILKNNSYAMLNMGPIWIFIE